MVVGGEHEVALGSAPHASNLLDRDHRHRVPFATSRCNSSILDQLLLVA
jgi:hypothetical protein